LTGTGSLPVNQPGIQAGGMIKTPANGVPGAPKAAGPRHHGPLGAPAANLPGKLNIQGPSSGASAIGFPGKANMQGPASGAPTIGLPGKINPHGPPTGAPAIGLPGKLNIHGLGSAQFIHTPGIARVVPTPFLPGSSFLAGGMSPGRKP
jgi:hypothetical protein